MDTLFDVSLPIGELEFSILKLIVPNHDWDSWLARFTGIAGKLETSSQSLNLIFQEKWNALRENLQSRAASLCSNFFLLRSKSTNPTRQKEIQAERLTEFFGELDSFESGIHHTTIFSGDFGSDTKWDSVSKAVGEMVKKIVGIDYGRTDGIRKQVREEIFAVAKHLTYQQDFVLLARLFVFLQGKNRVGIRPIFESNHPIWELQNKPKEYKNGYEIVASSGLTEFVVDYVEHRVYFRRLGKQVWGEVLRSNGFSWNGRRWSRSLSSPAIIAGKKIISQIQNHA